MAESPSAPGSAIKASTKHCSFLKLDEDIRRMVYDILEALPRKDMDKKDRARVRDFSQEAHEEFRKLTVTRKNLRLTCKQIKNEWTPAFLRSTTFCLSLIRMRLGFEIFVLNKLSKTEIMNIRRIVFDGSRQGLFAKYGCPDLRSSDAEVLRTLASVLTRHKDQLRLETLDITLFDDFGPRLLRREKEVTVAQLARYHYRKNGWKPYYIGMFETQITGRSWKERQSCTCSKGVLFNLSFDDKSRLPSDYNDIIQLQNPAQGLSSVKRNGM